MVAFCCLILSQIGLNYSGRAMLSYTPLSESRSGLGGLFEDLGLSLGVLGVMVATN